jgi:hypothetical protein
MGENELTVPRTEATESGLEDTIGVEYLYADCWHVSAT